jgi:heptosyltransferase-2
MNKILVRVPQWLGDAVVSTVFLYRLRSRFPDSDISVLTPPALQDLFYSHPARVHVLPLPKPPSPWKTAALLKPYQFDRVYVLPRSLRTALDVYLAKIPERIGYSGDGRGFLLTKTISYDPALKYAHRYLKLIEEENISLDHVRPYFPAEASKTNNTLDLLNNLKSPILGVGPASVAPSRTWDADRFIQTISNFLSETGGSVVLFGSEREKPVTRFIQSQIKDSIVDTAGEFQLPELGFAIQKCQAMLVNDSGLMHVAACFQIPTVVLFGASDPALAVPPWGRFRSLQHSEISCVPCLRNHCVRFGPYHRECLKAITVPETTSALRSILSSS